MDPTTENMTPEQMLEKIAELEYSQRQQRDLITEMTHWLDVADDDMAQLHSKNTFLTKQVKDLEKTISATSHYESESYGPILTIDLDVKRCNERKIQKLEEEFTIIEEENEKLTAELKTLQQEREQDKINLNTFKVVLQTLEKEMEEAQLGMQYRDEVIHQKTLKVEHLEEIVEEYLVVIEELRLTKQELRKQLEDKHDEALFCALNDQIGEKQETFSCPLSFAEEINLLPPLSKVNTSMSDSKHLRHGETDDEEQQTPQNLTVGLMIKRCARILETVVHTARLFMICIFVVTVLAFLASRNCARNYDMFSINTLWNCVRMMLQPYCSVNYGALPPI